MVFSNLVFLFIFLPAVLFLYYLSPKAGKNYILLLASLLFYAWGEPVYVLIMLGSICMNYLFARLLDQGKNAFQRKFWLVVSIIANLFVLGIFKYAGFFMENVNKLFHTVFPVPEIALPIGISFFTFQAMSYVIDVYRKDAVLQKNLFDLALYISLFPQLVAGPIVRYQTVADQITDRIHDWALFESGVKRFLIGLFKKVLIANPIGLVADEIFALSGGDLSTGTAWIGVMAYALQIYFDFSGYSDMAIGLGRMFGFKFLENFNYPYIAQSVTDFWRRWHISLSSWFRDYVYIPLGGNRVRPWKIYCNLFIVWTLTGFWHGASWTFLVWGFYYGVLIALERLFLGKLLAKLYRPLRHLYLLFIVMISWVFFRADDFSYSFDYIQTLFGFGQGALFDNRTLYYLNDYFWLILLGMVVATPIVPWLGKQMEKYMPSFYHSIVFQVLQTAVFMILFAGVIMMLVNSTYNPFIYFRF